MAIETSVPTIIKVCEPAGQGESWVVKCVECGSVVCDMTTDELHDFILWLVQTDSIVLCITCEKSE